MHPLLICRTCPRDGSASGAPGAALAQSLGDSLASCGVRILRVNCLGAARAATPRGPCWMRRASTGCAFPTSSQGCPRPRGGVALPLLIGKRPHSSRVPATALAGAAAALAPKVLQTTVDQRNGNAVRRAGLRHSRDTDRRTRSHRQRVGRMHPVAVMALRTLSPDLPGSGRTPAGDEVSTPALVKVLLGFMDRLSLDARTSWMNYCGSVLAQHLAVSHGKRVRSLNSSAPVQAPAEGAKKGPGRTCRQGVFDVSSP